MTGPRQDAEDGAGRLDATRTHTEGGEGEGREAGNPGGVPQPPEVSAEGNGRGRGKSVLRETGREGGSQY